MADQKDRHKRTIDIVNASLKRRYARERRFKAILSVQWAIVAEFDNPDRLPGPVPFAYRGLIARRHESTS